MRVGHENNAGGSRKLMRVGHEKLMRVGHGKIKTRILGNITLLMSEMLL
jgi:hypothetical protein